MQPRLKTSKKWTPLPQELVQQIQSVFKKNFDQHIRGGHVDALGKIFPEEILIGVGVVTPGRLKQMNWEISISYEKNKDNVLKLLHLAVDAIGALFEQSFASEDDQDFPRIWQEVDFEGRKIFVQFTTVNRALEAKADAILGISESDSDVAQGDWDDEIPVEHIKAHLGLGSDDDDGDPGGEGTPPKTH